MLEHHALGRSFLVRLLNMHPAYGCSPRFNVKFAKEGGEAHLKKQSSEGRLVGENLTVGSTYGKPPQPNDAAQDALEFCGFLEFSVLPYFIFLSAYPSSETC